MAQHPVQAPVVVERAGAITALDLPRRLPETSYQVAKIVFALLGAVCWLTGALLGFGRRHEVSGSRLVAGYWLACGGVLGCYVFAVDLCLPLLAVLLWLMTTILPALAVALHVWFPARLVSARRSMLARRLLLGTWAISNLVLAAVWLIWRPSLGDLLVHAWLPLVIALLASFLGSGVLLAAAYRHVRVAHVRRQIRLIAAACLITGCVWLLARLAPLLLALPLLLPDAVIDLVPILIPLAYLVGGSLPSLYTLDRLVRRLVGDILLVTFVAVAFSATAALVAGGQRAAVIWSGLALGMLCRFFSTWAYRLRRAQRNPDRSYAALRQARHVLTTSLDPEVLLAAIRDGVQGAFDRPPLAIYYAQPDAAPELSLVQHDRLPDLPPSLPQAALTAHLAQRAPIVEARALHRALQAAPLSAPEEAALHHRGLALWCVVRQGRETILALALIGTDVSLEPYRAEDRRELAELMDAAGLALAHSSAYARVLQTEGTLRELFHAMRKVEDEAAAELARGVHDEIINGYVQLNILALQRLLANEMAPSLRAELELLLESERGMSKALRVICERLFPTGLDDPIGLPGVLRGLTQRMVAMWPGSCRLRIAGQPIPIDPAIQLELYRIAREALANAVKHAEATTITVELVYPAGPDQELTLAISDDGRARTRIQPRAGHWGVRNMQESARAAGGSLAFARALGGGTRVVVTFRPSRDGRPDRATTRALGQKLRSAALKGSSYAASD